MTINRPVARYFQPLVTIDRRWDKEIYIPVSFADENKIVSSRFKLLSTDLGERFLKYSEDGTNFTDHIAYFEIRVPEFINPGRYLAEIEIVLDLVGPIKLELDVDLR